VKCFVPRSAKSAVDPVVCQDVIRRPSFWLSPISRAMSCDLLHYSLFTAEIMASVLFVVPAICGRPAFIHAVSVTRPVSKRRCRSVKIQWRLNDVEQNNVVGISIQFAVFVACVFHDHSIKTEPYRVLGTLCS
jgi:hypothetical protein